MAEPLLTPCGSSGADEAEALSGAKEHRSRVVPWARQPVAAALQPRRVWMLRPREIPGPGHPRGRSRHPLLHWWAGDGHWSLFPACGKEPSPVTHEIPEAAPWHSLPPAPGRSRERRSLLGHGNSPFAGIPHSGAGIPRPGFPCKLPLLLPPPHPAFQPGFVPWAPTTAGDTPRASFGGRGGEHYPAQHFTERNGPGKVH